METEEECTKTEAEQKLIELSAQNSDDIDEFTKYFHLATRPHEDYSYHKWLDDPRFGPHVKFLIYKSFFNMSGYISAEKLLDGPQTDQDFHDYLCNNINEKNFDLYRRFISEFLELNGRFMCFHFTQKTCDKLIDILEYPEKYGKYQVCCATDIVRYSYYRFDCIYNDPEYYKKLAVKWKNIVLETEDEEICAEGLYYVLGKGGLEQEEYHKVVERLLDKHPDDRVTQEIYRRHYMNPNFAYPRLIALENTGSKNCEILLENFCNAVVSSEFLTSIDCDVNHQLIQFAFSRQDTFRYCLEYMIDKWYNGSYSRAVDILVEMCLNPISDNEAKLKAYNIFQKITSSTFRNLKNKNQFESTMSLLKVYIDKWKEKYFANLENELVRMRCVQALAILSFPTKDVDQAREYIKECTVSLLINEAKSGYKSNSIKQILLSTLMFLLKSPRDFREVKQIMEQTKDIPELTEVSLFLFYQLISSSKWTQEDIETLTSYLVPLGEDSNNKIRILEQMITEKVSDFCKRKHFKNTPMVPVCDSTLNKEDLGTDLVFLKNYDFSKHHSVESVLYLIPKLNQVNKDELIDTSDGTVYWVSAGPSRKPTGPVDSFKNAVEDFITKINTVK
ncbi:uncharacterized protein LOC115891415 [Sitophilus oryzae]|uniref:Uncharacterized protein LOC115891415 n=1 Tax=Sitophilus oryzae TaxID=7048 RepID=A0A6J2YY19_SITOR|nr:uncharacterized protein LOC115891415 [Sitophilus oryzae]XP_030767727.1 uncharacterized protein LOC115891415 [Sitophilus oryzae]